MRSLILLGFLLSACSGGDEPAADSDTDSDDTDGGDGGGEEGGDEGGEDTDWADLELNGSWPAQPVSAPEFTVTNMDGTSRSREDLLGQPTVMWFYPLAASSG